MRRNHAKPHWPAFARAPVARPIASAPLPATAPSPELIYKSTPPGPALKIALCLGGAASVWDDARRACELVPAFDLVLAVNDIGTKWPGRLTHWVSLHPDKLRRWQDARAAAGLNTDYIGVCHTKRSDARITLVSDDWSGSGGLFAVKVAIEQGADRVICAGIPMTPTPHFFDDKPWRFSGYHQKAWVAHLADYQSKTRSMSGWTAELIGEPDEAWLRRATT